MRNLNQKFYDLFELPPILAPGRPSNLTCDFFCSVLLSLPHLSAHVSFALFIENSSANSRVPRPLFDNRTHNEQKNNRKTDLNFSFIAVKTSGYTARRMVERKKKMRKYKFKFYDRLHHLRESVFQRLALFSIVLRSPDGRCAWLGFALSA